MPNAGLPASLRWSQLSPREFEPPISAHRRASASLRPEVLLCYSHPPRARSTNETEPHRRAYFRDTSAQALAGLSANRPMSVFAPDTWPDADQLRLAAVLPRRSAIRYQLSPGPVAIGPANYRARCEQP